MRERQVTTATTTTTPRPKSTTKTQKTAKRPIQVPFETFGNKDKSAVERLNHVPYLFH